MVIAINIPAVFQEAIRTKKVVIPLGRESALAMEISAEAGGRCMQIRRLGTMEIVIPSPELALIVKL